MRSTLLFLALLVVGCDSAVPEESPPPAPRFDTLPTAADAPLDLTEYRDWTRWKTPVLRVSLDFPVARIHKVRFALEAWADATSISFVESDEDPHLRISEGEGSHCELYQTDCPPAAFGEILGHTYQRGMGVSRSEIHLNAALDEEYRFAATLHHIGHALGLGHSSDPQSVMFQEARPIAIADGLTETDIADIRALYGPPNGTPPASSAPLRVPPGFAASCLAATGVTADLDGDGLPNDLERYVFRTDPENCDTDFDDVGDGEVLVGMHPRHENSDGDIYEDAGELSRGYAPFLPSSWYPGGSGLWAGNVTLSGHKVEFVTDDGENRSRMAIGAVFLKWGSRQWQVDVRGGFLHSGDLILTSADHSVQIYFRQGEAASQGDITILD